MGKRRKPGVERIIEPPSSLACRSLREWLLEGRFAKGQALSSERKLAELLDVSRGTVRIALRRLKQEGLIETDSGGRPAVVRAPVTPSGTMAQTIVLLTGTNATSPYTNVAGFMESAELGVIDVTERAGLNLLRIHPSQLHSNGAAPVVRERPMGVVVTHWVGETWRDAEFYAPFRDSGIPLVVNGDDPHLKSLDRVVPDHDAGAYDITSWMLERGCRRILRLWSADADSYWMRMRNAGHERALAESGVAPLPSVDIRELGAVSGSTSVDPERAYRAGVRLIAGCLSEYVLGKKRKIDALMLTTDSEARMAAEACELLEVKPNVDVLIVGYDNTGFDRAVPLVGARGPVATVDKCNVEMGRAMTGLLIDRIEGRLSEEPARILMRPTLLTCSAT